MPASVPPTVSAGGVLSAVRARSPGGLAHPVPAGMRDLLPAEAGRQLALGRRVLDCFGCHGYEPVSVPPFEYADVLEQEIGNLDPGRVLRFVEPETGEVVALRPDMTPQIARLISSRLADAPPPLRLCYEGSVVRRRQERARRDREIRQAGVELVGLSGLRGDLEVLNVACSAITSAGLERYTLDLGHAMIAGSLIAGLPPGGQGELIQALTAKDTDGVGHLARAQGVRGDLLAALVELPTLYGGEDVWERAQRVLSKTPAAIAVKELRELWDQVLGENLAPHVVVDFGETWNFSYYTGPMFHILAEGPGEAVGSGGRYDQLFDRFGSERPAAGFAIDLGNLGWAIERAGPAKPGPLRILVSGAPLPTLGAILPALRRLALASAEAPQDGNTTEYAKAWRYSHILRLSDTGATLIDVLADRKLELRANDASELATAVAAVVAERK